MFVGSVLLIVIYVDYLWFVYVQFEYFTTRRPFKITNINVPHYTEFEGSYTGILKANVMFLIKLKGSKYAVNGRFRRSRRKSRTATLIYLSTTSLYCITLQSTHIRIISVGHTSMFMT